MERENADKWVESYMGMLDYYNDNIRPWYSPPPPPKPALPDRIVHNFSLSHIFTQIEVRMFSKEGGLIWAEPELKIFGRDCWCSSQLKPSVIRYYWLLPWLSRTHQQLEELTRHNMILSTSSSSMHRFKLPLTPRKPLSQG